MQNEWYYYCVHADEHLETSNKSKIVKMRGKNTNIN